VPAKFDENAIVLPLSKKIITVDRYG